MRKAFYTATATIAIGGIILGASVARADEDTYVADMHAAGYDAGPDSNLISVGHQICGELSNGWSSYEAARHLYIVSHLTTLDSATRVVDITIKDLCPVYKTGTNV
jgi:hypothetical protein